MRAAEDARIAAEMAKNEASRAAVLPTCKCDAAHCLWWLLPTCMFTALFGLQPWRTRSWPESWRGD